MVQENWQSFHRDCNLLNGCSWTATSLHVMLKALKTSLTLSLSYLACLSSRLFFYPPNKGNCMDHNWIVSFPTYTKIEYKKRDSSKKRFIARIVICTTWFGVLTGQPWCLSGWSVVERHTRTFSGIFFHRSTSHHPKQSTVKIEEFFLYLLIYLFADPRINEGYQLNLLATLCPSPAN